MGKYLISFILCCSFLFANNDTVAISYFDNTSNLKEYDAFSKGLADMLITDLSKVKSLQIVEREKLESLLKEINLGDGGFIDAFDYLYKNYDDSFYDLPTYKKIKELQSK